MAPPSTRPWLGAGAALTALPAAGGCFCAALLLAVVVDADAGGVYEQHRWLGAVVAAGAVCAYVAMMGWATLRHGGVPVPVLLMALVVAGVPFALPGALLLPGTALAVAACAALATAGLGRPPESARGVRRLSGGLGAAAAALAVAQAVAVSALGLPAAPRAEVRSSSTGASSVAAAEPAATAEQRRARPRPVRPAPSGAGRAAAGPKAAPPVATAAPVATAPPPTAGAERFVRDYYAALDARRFALAWAMLDPAVQRAFGGFDAWRRGYARTVASSPGSVRITAAGGGATVGLILRAGDRDGCGRTVVRRFAVTWRLARTDAGWRATAAEAGKLSGPEPAAAC